MRIADADCEVFFRHQQKEEDYMIKTDWLQELKNTETLKVGASYCEQKIALKGYVDYEALQKNESPAPKTCS